MNDRWRVWWWAAVCGVAIQGAAGRIWQTRESLWVDELHTAWCVGGPLSEVAGRAAIGNQSPLFFWLEWLMVRWLGPSEFSLRLVSVAAGSLLPLALFEVGRRWSGSAWVGFVAAALVIVDPLAIFFATEARPYALVQLLAVLHVWTFAEMLRQPTRWLRVAFVGGAAILFYLHYTAGLLLAAEVVAWCVLLVMQRGGVRYRWSMFVLDGGLIVALLLPASVQVAEVFHRRGNWAGFIGQKPLGEIFEVLPWSGAAVWVLGWIAYDAARHWVYPNLAVDEYASGINPEARVSEARDVRRLGRVMALCWLMVPLAIAWVLTAADVARILLPRYLAASAPAAILLAAMGVNFAPWRWGKISVGVALIVAAFWTSGIAEQWREDGRLIGDRKEDWRGAVAWLNERLASETHPVFIASGLIEADGLARSHPDILEEYCLLPVTSLYSLNVARDDLVPLTYRDPGELRPEARALLEARGSSWVIARGRHAAGFRSRNGQWSVRESKEFGNLYVALLVTQMTSDK